MNLKKVVADIVGNRLINAEPLGNNTTLTLKLTLDDDRQFAAKVVKQDAMDDVDSEVLMLEHIQRTTDLPTPGIVSVKPGLLLMELIPFTSDWMTPASEVDVAQHLATFHCAPADYCGFEIDTSVNGIHQPNDVNMNWCDFFINQRLRWGAQLCVDSGQMPARLAKRIDALIELLPNIIPHDIPPSLLHGDLWKGNILVDGPKVKAFIDPALYYGHSEMDLAFLSMFGKVSNKFYDAYSEIRPLDKAFLEERKWLYLIWPILINIRLRGSNFVKHLDSMLTKFGV
ncbi:fructosamine kinase family protein [Temperatibacter marinus]|uniref:Fructosamine kinase family protein n=1 Tax=Temperatibacter marinus TaxID=1456591 RepID=A0AA52EIE3_9PROT|nr:fructosamine kinase family protein [Temperatibacter marinus]WND03370.1 fructosamine kinase family protein [Temperatibacter marinus]